jgi:hypothetical protein
MLHGIDNIFSKDNTISGCKAGIDEWRLAASIA